MKLDYERLNKRGIQLHNQAPFETWGSVQIEGPTFCAARLRLDTVMSIGAFCNLNHNSEIGHTRIGRYTSIAQSCFVGSDRHPTDWLSTSRVFYVPGFRNFSSGFEDNGFKAAHFANTGTPVAIGNDVLIANNCIINRDVTIGTGAIIAPGSVVTKDVPPYAIVGGNPARIIRYRFSDDLIERLLQSRWWDYAVYEMGDAPFQDPARFLDWFDERRDQIRPYKPAAMLNNDNYRDFVLA